MEEEKNGNQSQTNLAIVDEKTTNNSEIMLENTEKFEDEKSRKRKNKIKITIIIMLILIASIILFSTIFAVMNIKSTKIPRGVHIAKIDFSNMTKEEAKSILEEIYSKKAENEILFKYEDFETTTTYEALEVEYQIDKAIDEAYNVGRKGNIIKDNWELIKAIFQQKEIELEATIDEEMLNQIIQNINNSIEGAVVQPSYYRKEGEDKLIITEGKEGLKVNEEQIYIDVYELIKNQTDMNIVKIPLENVQPDKIDLQKIYEEIHKEVQDAYYTQNPFKVYPEVEGVDFDIENAKNIIAEKKEQYEIPLIITKPNKTTKEIGTEAFPDLLATFSTQYQSSNVNRTTNLKLAADKINGIVLLPGEEFSYNKTVGERTVQAGFKEAAVFNAGRVENGLGGGICQISSTLYDAVVMADLDVTVRRNHQFVTSYVKAGADATVVWGSQDFKFKNTRKYPIKITITVSGGVATAKIWGVKEEVEYDITIETKKTATIPYTTQYVQDSSLPEGQQKIVQSGSNGQKVEAYKVKRLNGQVISTTLLSKDTYNAMKKIVHVGTAQ